MSKENDLSSYKCPRCGRVGNWTGIIWDDNCEMVMADCGYCDFLLYESYDNISVGRVNARTREAIGNTAPWEKKYYDYPCPYCGKYMVRLAKWDDKSLSTAFWGAFSYKLHCNYKCDNCKQMWE